MTQGVTVTEAMGLVFRARPCYAWIKVCPDDGVYIKITKAQARYLIHLARQNFSDVRVLAALDQDGDLLIA